MAILSPQYGGMAQPPPPPQQQHQQHYPPYPPKSAAAVDAERDDDDDECNNYNAQQHQQQQQHHPNNNNNNNNSICQFNRNSSTWECTTATNTNNVKSDYKAMILQQVMDQCEYKDGSRATIDQLKEFGITVYLAEYGSVDMFLLKQVVQHVSASKLDRMKSHYDNQRCLIYRDESGRLYNLTINNGCDGLASTWKSLLLSFSGLQAMTALVILTRAYACTGVANAILRPGYLSLILGLILYEEISYVWVNVAIFVQGTPSVAALTIISPFDSDWPRKLALTLLALTSAMKEGSDYQRYCALGGIGLAILLLASNLGARAWYFLKWRPLRGGGVMSTCMAPYLSMFVATLVGLVFPYIGFSKIQAGGKSAVQLVIVNSLLVATLFVLSDFDFIQSFIIDGSQSCNQDTVNIAVGIWFTMTTITCLFASQQISTPEPHPEDSNPILVRDETSPVGYKVPNFPDFAIDPIHFGNQGLPCFSIKTEMVVGTLLGIGVGAFVVMTGFSDFISEGNEYIVSTAG